MSQIEQDRSSLLQYQYASLAPESQEIRLLTLYPGNWNDEIRCATRVVSLDLNPIYEAISYVWGNSKDTKTILLDECNVTVRSNLESVLRHLRKSNQESSIWVDALCIDQENTTEKTYQVSMMREIYSACSRVYIWLGTPDSQLYGNTQMEKSSTPSKELPAKSTNASAWDNPFALVEHFAENKHFFELPGYIASTSSDIPFRFEENHFRQIWENFCSALHSSWWTRLWCVQEALLPSEALVMLGCWSITWEKFSTAGRNHHQHQLGCCADTMKLMASHFIFYLDSLVMDRRFPAKVDEKVGPSEQFNLDFVLRRYRHKHCQDPRDKVYGLLGIIEVQNSRKLLPDYSLLLHDVLINAMEAIILESDGDLRYLTGSGFNSQRQGVPTWVRDLTSTLDLNAGFQESQRVNAYTMYNASKGTVSKAINKDRTKLVLTGFTIDRVCKVGEPVQNRDIDRINEVLKHWHHIADLDYHSHISFSSNSNQEVFWRTMIADTFLDLEMKWKRLGCSELKAYEHWVSNFPFSAKPETQSPLGQTFLLAMRAAICGRAIFVTEYGNVGLCEPTTRAGDEVCILYGGRVPFVLRPLGPQLSNDSPHYALIGDCHITMFMDGEAFQQTSHMVREIVLE